MGFNTFPCNPYPISTEELDKGNNDELNSRVTALESDVSDLDSGKANKVDIATEFSDLTNYNAGDLVYYDGALYEYQVDHTAGAWETSEVTQKDLSDIVTTLKSGLTGLELCNTLQSMPIYLAGSTELNTITNVGVYGGHVYPSNLGHSPEPNNLNASYIKLIVSEIGSNTNKVLVQECHLMSTVGTMHVYTRYLSGTEWTEWAS